MKLLNKYQSCVFQFTLALLARLERGDSVTPAQLQKLAQDNRLDYYNRVVSPLMRCGILERDGKNYRLSEEFGTVRFPMSTMERDYLAYLLSRPEAELFLSEDTRAELEQVDGDAGFFAPVEYYVPEGEEIPRNPGAVGFRTLVDAIQGGRMIRYQYRTREDRNYRECVMTPWKLEYSVYDRRWWVILYNDAEKRTIKAKLSSLKDIKLDRPAECSREEIDEAMENLLMPEPVVLRVADIHNVLERCFLVLESQLFQETVLEEDGSCRVEFRYYRFDENELLRKLLYLGPDVTLVGPQGLKKKLMFLLDQALEG